ncbi:prefoldin, alpha subunit [Microbotryum lychnidis-dioicae p1A1 Lamole]|uniref:Prefoldin, alpha subunit n=1 Tax=Microbotryum lychnidis-dioicae (strain p1A1 Lamole / MvSl-1064) TaxID=683840 RepID=U5H3Y6_USTV1|nr:prefoldin, alpha subunit [Microbotryum lychnidis-dioicae p1A1 Lamole]|eukprot:KDE07769.1 prefoldin, alpha subunit [Microbotryum lychnidis-dioicae p1A1 Lamole]
MATPSTSSVPLAAPSLPLPTELEQLLLSQSQLQYNLASLQQLATRLSELSQARKEGNERMDIAVDLGMGYTIQGAVPNTDKIIVASGVQDLWVQLRVDEAEKFVAKRHEILQKRSESLNKEVDKLRQEYALVAETLRRALAPPSTEVDDA